MRGMSQTLALILTAVVVAMMAFLLISVGGNTITDQIKGSETSTCKQTVKSQCKINPDKTFDSVPPSCEGEEVITQGQSCGSIPFVTTN